jgi:hypothetical protein
MSLLPLAIGFMLGRTSMLDVSVTMPKEPGKNIIVHNVDVNRKKLFAKSYEYRYLIANNTTKDAKDTKDTKDIGDKSTDFKQRCKVEDSGALIPDLVFTNCTVEDLFCLHSNGELQVPERTVLGVLEKLGYTSWVPYKVKNKDMPLTDLPEVVRFKYDDTKPTVTPIGDLHVS